MGRLIFIGAIAAFAHFGPRLMPSVPVKTPLPAQVLIDHFRELQKTAAVAPSVNDAAARQMISDWESNAASMSAEERAILEEVKAITENSTEMPVLENLVNRLERERERTASVKS